ncbi:hypothetical protein [Vibrio hannami]
MHSHGDRGNENKKARHSCEGRNLFELYTVNKIPAFAGMTMEKSRNDD